MIFPATVNLQQKWGKRPDFLMLMFQLIKQAFPNIHRLLSIFKISMPSHHPVFNRWVHKFYCLIRLCQQAMNYSAWHAGPSSSLQPLLGSPCWSTTLRPNNSLFPVYGENYYLGWIPTTHTAWETGIHRENDYRSYSGEQLVPLGLCCHLMFERQKYTLVPTAAEEAPAYEDCTLSHSSRNRNLDLMSWLV